MAAFLIAQAQAWARGLSLDCGCFGALAQQKVGFWSIARDAALGIPGLVLAFRPARYLSLDQRFLGLPDAFGPRPDA
jgi:putative oxidoreductase